MKTVYVTEQGSFLIKKGKEILVKKESTVLARLKLHQIDQVVLFGNVNITTPVVHLLLKEGVEIIFLTAGGRWLGKITSTHSKNIELRKLQFEKAKDENFKREITEEIVRAKLENQKEMLRRLQLWEGKGKFNHSISQINQLISTLKGKNIKSLRGYEGRGSAIYFSAIKLYLQNKNINFEGRQFYPPPDEFNSLLSFLYTLLLNTVLNFILVHSLEPMLGNLHVEEYGKPSLALDLMEEWRPAVADYIALRLIRNGRISSGDFYFPEKENPPYPDMLEDFRDLPVVLRKETIKKVVAAFETRMREKMNFQEKKFCVKDIIENQILNYAKALKGEKYKGFIWR